MTFALDLGTTTGWATRSAAGLLEFGSQTWRPQAKPELREPEAVVYSRFSDWLHSREPDRVVFEEVKRHLSNRSAAIYHGLRGVMLAYCDANSTEAVPVGVGTLKKWATGKGNAPKNEMVAAARQTLMDDYAGRSLESHDEADAVLLLLYDEATR